MPKTTQKQFDYFKANCEDFVGKLGLIEWNTDYQLKKLDNNIAEVAPNITARRAIIRLDSNLKAENGTDECLQKVAFEEVCHVLLANLAHYGLSYYNDDIVIEEEHIIIRHLWHMFNQLD